MNRKILGGLAATIAALSIAAPAHAQEVIPPAQPSAPSGQPMPYISPAQPAAPNVTVGFGPKCSVTRSSHGYTYAVCSVQAANVPSGQTVSSATARACTRSSRARTCSGAGRPARSRCPTTASPASRPT